MMIQKSCLSLTGATLCACNCRCRVHRVCWLGLYKITASRSSSTYWYATTWYDTSKSTFRWWARGYPRYRYESCVGYTDDGWVDMPCTDENYFSCKKEAGRLLFMCLVFGYVVLFTYFVIICPMAITYSMGQIIKPVCVGVLVCCTLAVLVCNISF